MKLKKIKTVDIIIMAFLMTMEIILTRFFAIQTPALRIGFGFLPMAIMAIMYGPLWAGLSYAACDVLGMMIFPRGPYFPGFTFTAFLTGLIYGLILHNKTVTWKRSFAAAVIVGIFCNLVLDTVWLHIITGSAVWVLLPFRLLRVGITIPLQTVIISVVCKRLHNLIHRFRIFFPARIRDF